MADRKLCLLGLILLGISSVSMDDPGWFWHITDFHYDFSYWGQKLSQTGPVTSPLGIYGDQWLDSPWLLISSTLDEMAKIMPGVDFLLWTGDSVAHISDKDLSEATNLAILANITADLDRTFPRNVVYASYGNHDYYPSNLFPPNGSSPIYNLTAELWLSWIPADQLDNFRKGGYYTVKTERGLRLLVLNTNLYYTSNSKTNGVEDPAGQFAWMEQVLGQAKKSNEKVMLTAHIPPGIEGLDGTMWFQETFNTRFLHILDAYADVISAFHHGHEHTDLFRIYFKNGEAAVPLFSAPSLTPWRFNLTTRVGQPHNPGVRLVKFNRTTGATLEIRQYYLDLEKANAANRTDWLVEYNFTEAYNVSDVTAASLGQIWHRMENGEDMLTDSFYRYRTVNLTEGQPACGKDCRRKIVCGIRYFDRAAYTKCLNDTSITTPQTTSPASPLNACPHLLLACLATLLVRG